MQTCSKCGNTTKKGYRKYMDQSINYPTLTPVILCHECIDKYAEYGICVCEKCRLMIDGYTDYVKHMKEEHSIEVTN